ncbi:MAG: hypothetical protein B7X64_09490, partial [Halothiobacillus sp. 39-53-45]
MLLYFIPNLEPIIVKVLGCFGLLQIPGIHSRFRRRCLWGWFCKSADSANLYGIQKFQHGNKKPPLLAAVGYFT